MAKATTRDLLTGFPGFIGRRVARRLLADDPKLRLTALVEPRMLGIAQAAAVEIDAERLEVVPGDIGERRLGLDDELYGRLVGEVRRVFHLAAIYDLAVPLEVAERVNVGGTGNVLELCADADSLEHLVYVSTAYVAGTRTGVVFEHELVMGQGFKNHYESTKFQAEVWVRERMDEIPTTILRPAIVVGDSASGETQKFDGPYYILRLVSWAARYGRSIPQSGRSDAPFNVVPVDFVEDAIAATAATGAAVGETLHLVDPDPLSSRQLAEALSYEYAGLAPRGRIPPALADVSLRFAAVRKLFSGIPRESVIYLNHSVAFDTRRARAVLEPLGLRPPVFRDYVGAMVRFFREHEDDPAFAPGGSR